MDHGSAAVVSVPAPLIAPKISAQQAIVWVLFLFSGICGLIYEVLWCRHLGLLFGNTVHSMSAVLTAFMAGLALGSYLGGRVCHRLKRPMMAYGVLELLIGVYCLFLPWAFGINSPILPLYRSLYGVDGGGASLSVARFAISFILLLIPTTFMGATLPVLAQFLVRSKHFFGRTVGALYAINTFGAVLGAALTGFLLLPMLGKANSNLLAVAANLILGTLAVVFGMKEDVPTGSASAPQDSTNSAEKEPDDDEPGSNALVSPLALKLTILTFGLTGFAAMATQIGWTRAISLATGSSTYAFSLIVSIFIMGLSFGGVWGSRMAAKATDPLALLGKILIAIGLVSMALTAILGFGPNLFFFVIAMGQNHGWNWQLAYQAMAIAVLIFCPTFLMGATMPLTMQVASQSKGSAGRTVGTIYAVNTLGSILGSFFGGLVLLEKLQIRGTLQLMSFLYIAPGLALYFLSRSGRTRTPKSEFMIVILGALTFGGVLAFAPAWDPMTMSSGKYLLRDEATIKAVKEFRWMDAIPSFKGITMLYYNEGAAATVAVTKVSSKEHADELSLSVGGKPDASSHGDMSTQMGLALIPELIHETGPEDVLVIGLGSGASAGAALAPASVKNVDVVEMSPEVVEASYFFAPYTHLKYAERKEKPGFYWLDTPKVNLIVNDGRNHLLLTSKKYDVIASEPSNPWLAGVGNLFTKEAFELTRAHLKKGGVMCQWIHRYSLEEADFFNIVKTFAEAYPHVELWCVNKHDFLLIGSDQKIRMEAGNLRARMAEPAMHKMLEEIHFDSEEELIACFMSADSEMRKLSEKSKLHTDDNMLLEFSAPKALYYTEQLLRSTQFEPDPESVYDITGLKPADRADTEKRLDLAASGREHTRCAFERAGDQVEHFTVAHVLAPKQLWVLENLKLTDAEVLRRVSVAPAATPGPTSLEQARKLVENGKIDKALAFLQKISDEDSKGYDSIEAAVILMKENGQAERARETLKRALKGPEMRSDAKTAKLWAMWASIYAEDPKAEPEVAIGLSRLAEHLAEDSHDNDLTSEAQKPFEKRASPASKVTGGTGWLLLKYKNFPAAYAEFWHLCATNALRADFRLGLSDALVGLGSDPVLQKASPQAALRHLRHARRAAREAIALKQDDPAAWQRLARAQLALSKMDASSADYHKQCATEAWVKSQPLGKGTGAANLKLDAAVVKQLGDELGSKYRFP